MIFEDINVGDKVVIFDNRATLSPDLHVREVVRVTAKFFTVTSVFGGYFDRFSRVTGRRYGDFHKGQIAAPYGPWVEDTSAAALAQLIIDLGDSDTGRAILNDTKIWINRLWRTLQYENMTRAARG